MTELEAKILEHYGAPLKNENLTTFEKLHKERTTISVGEFFSWGLSEQSIKPWKVDAIMKKEYVKKTYTRQGFLRRFILKNQSVCNWTVALDKTDEYYILGTSGRYYNIWKCPKEIKKIGVKI